MIAAIVIIFWLTVIGILAWAFQLGGPRHPGGEI